MSKPTESTPRPVATRCKTCNREAWTPPGSDQCDQIVFDDRRCGGDLRPTADDVTLTAIVDPRSTDDGLDSSLREIGSERTLRLSALDRVRDRVREAVDEAELDWVPSRKDSRPGLTADRLRIGDDDRQKEKDPDREALR